MKAPVLKSRFWCLDCYILHLPQENAICHQCQKPMISVELIVNRYVFIHQNRLGKGVIKVWDQRMKRWTALKFPEGKKQYQAKDNHSKTFTRIDREMLIQAQLEHPAIVSAYDVVEDPDYGKGLVMNLIEGATLYHIILKRGGLRVRLAVEIIRDITEAIRYMHQKGIIHRDLTPGNIIMAGKKPILIDFGLAKELADTRDVGEASYLSASNVSGKDVSVTKEGEILGTPLFMSPEQIEGNTKRIDFRSDIYGLGATLYFIITGKPPFVGEDVLSIVSQVLHNDPIPPRTINPAIDPSLEAIIQKAMKKDREQRFQTVKDFSEMLQCWLDGDELPLSVYKVPLFEKIAQKVVSMQKTFVILFAIMGILLTVSSFLYLSYVRSKSKKSNSLSQSLLDNSLIRDREQSKIMEIALRAKNSKKYELALNILDFLKKDLKKNPRESGEMKKQIKELEKTLETKKKLWENFYKGEHFFKKANELIQTKMEVSAYFYLQSISFFQEIYGEKIQENKIHQKTQLYIQKIVEKGAFFEKKNAKFAFAFYRKILKSMEAFFPDFPDENIQKIVLKLKIKVREMLEQIRRKSN